MSNAKLLAPIIIRHHQTVIVKVDGHQISRPSVVMFGFHIISHYQGKSWRMPNLRTLSGHIWISHYPSLWRKLADDKS